MLVLKYVCSRYCACVTCWAGCPCNLSALSALNTERSRTPRGSASAWPSYTERPSVPSRTWRTDAIRHPVCATLQDIPGSSCHVRPQPALSLPSHLSLSFSTHHTLSFPLSFFRPLSAFCICCLSFPTMVADGKLILILSSVFRCSVRIFFIEPKG